MNDTLFKMEFVVMGGPGQIVVQHDDERLARSQVELAIEEARRIEKKYSRYLPNSVVSRINRAAGSGEFVACDGETSQLLDFASQLYDNSDGLFDITSGVLRRIWDFNHASLPAKSALDAQVEGIGWNKVERRDGGIHLARQGMELDFGGFGKEYAADRMASMLQAAGIEHGYVNLAGDVRVVGAHRNGAPWDIGIRHPRVAERLFAKVEVYRGALATSGDYERYFELGGKRYCHILNPKTGWPVSFWQSVSVMAPIAVAAGSCSTIAFLMEERAIDFLERTGFGYLAINHLGSVFRKNV